METTILLILNIACLPFAAMAGKMVAELIFDDFEN